MPPLKRVTMNCGGIPRELESQADGESVCFDDGVYDEIIDEEECEEISDGSPLALPVSPHSC